ncbi:WhiB family transcriptional regulator [Streptomyces sp. NPDC089424]|uniref:WhiB family transcriptional regulator n=1 Tax=Streptomyces sp. NPDC089424 TaxID=3365917 RepID=UPI003811BE91
MSNSTRLTTTPATDNPEWRKDAACARIDPELFFPIGSHPQVLQEERQAKEVCRRCTVRLTCLDWALVTGQAHGVWGGLTENERRQLGQPVAVQPIQVDPVRSPGNRESRYWPAYPNAVEGILGTRMPEVRALIRQKARVGEMALALQTNVQTVKRLLDRVAEMDAAQASEEVEAA